MKTGFTLVELLLALALSGLVFVMASSLMVTLLAAQTKSRRIETFDQAKNDVFVDLYHTLKWSKNISVVNDGRADTLSADANSYTIDGGRLLKNGQPLTPQNITVSAFDVDSHSAAAGFHSLAITLTLQDPDFNLSQDTLKIIVSQRQTEVNQ